MIAALLLYGSPSCSKTMSENTRQPCLREQRRVSARKLSAAALLALSNVHGRLFESATKFELSACATQARSSSSQQASPSRAQALRR